jgi:Fe(3+) dicitrate transport protein
MHSSLIALIASWFPATIVMLPRPSTPSSDASTSAATPTPKPPVSEAATPDGTLPNKSSSQDNQRPSNSAASQNAPSASAQKPVAPISSDQKPAASESETKEATLDTLVITASNGVPLTYPGGRDVIEEETMAKFPQESVPDLLRTVPGVYVVPENGNDSRLNIGIRGNDPRRSGLAAILVDGIPVSEAPYGNTDVDGLPIAFERIWRVDVIRGGASVRYGPNSAGGVVNFLTEPIPDTPMLRLGGRYGSYNDYSSSLAVGGTYDAFGYLVSGVIKGGDGFRDSSEYQDFDGSIKMRYALNPTEAIQAYVSRFDEPDAKQPGGLTQAAYDADPSQSLRPLGAFHFFTDRYVLQYSNAIDTDSTFEVKSWYQNGVRKLDDVRPILAPFETTRIQHSEFDSGALEASYSWETKLFGLKNSFFHSARYLVEENDELYYRQELTSPTTRGGPTTQVDLDDNFKGKAFSLFNEDKVSILGNLDWAFGFRVESIAMSGVSNETGTQIAQDYTPFLPETNVTWTFAPRTAFYASYQKGFYPPQYETGFDPASVLYAPTKPESSDAYEIGLRSREVDGLEATLALFDTEYEDKIDFVNTSAGIKVPVNSGHVRAEGVELGGNYQLGTAMRVLNGWMLYGSITAQESKITDGVNDGNDTPRSPHLLASWGTEYDHQPTGLWGRIGGAYASSVFNDPANIPVGSADGVNGPSPAYTLWDCAVGWNQHPDRSGFAVTAGITNMFDEAYFRRFSTGIFPGAPRQYSVAVSYTFLF